MKLVTHRRSPCLVARIARTPVPVFVSALVPLLVGGGASAQTASIVSRSLGFHFDGIDVARDGNLYFGGAWSGTQVFRMTPEGGIEVVADGLEGPIDTVMDSQGYLYVSNYSSTWVGRISPEGEVQRFAETPLGPAGMAIDSADHVFVSIYGTPRGEGHSVLRLSPGGEVETWIDSPELAAVVGIAVDDEDVLYVGNGRDGRIFRCTRRGELEPFASLPLLAGNGGVLHMDHADGSLFATSSRSAVYRIDPRGVVSDVLHAGVSGGRTAVPGSSLLTTCNGLAASPDGRTLWVGTFVDGERALVRIDEPVPANLATAWQAIEAGQFSLAAHLYDALAAQETVLPEVWYGMGTLHLAQGDPAEARALFELAAETPRFRGQAAHGLARAHFAAGEREQAFDVLAAALEDGTTNRLGLHTDPALEALRADPRWAELLR